MQEFKSTIIEKIKSNPRRLVLPEGEDVRVLHAAELCMNAGIASEVIVLGDPDSLTKKAHEEGVSLKGVNIFTPESSEKLNDYAEEMYGLRKNKGLTRDQALELMKDVVYFGAMMIRRNDADAMVSGSMTPTSKTVRAALQIVRTKQGNKTVSGSFVMITPSHLYGAQGRFIYADCGVVPEPTAEQLADITMASADTARCLLGVDPIVALLSFSTKGSADSPSVQKVREAYEILKLRKPDFIFDGEMQLDAAIMPSICAKKAPNSPVEGRANVLIFPDLNAGNITYKATQRLAGAEAFGPLLQGLNKPVNDLSRGASPADIYMVSAITLAQAI